MTRPPAPQPIWHPPEMSRPPKISVVIPSLNGATERGGIVYLDLVHETLAEQSFRDFDVTVVDDGSTDGSVDYLREHWPETRIVALPENAGYPHAANRGIEASDGTYIALLNSDLELSPDWLQLLSDALDRDPSLGFATGKVLRFHDRKLLEQAGQDLYRCGRFHPRGIDEEDRGQYDAPREILVATAAAVLYRRTAVEAAGGFDDDYFIYCEDADLCLRMVLSGYRGLYLPEPRAFHMQGGTVGLSSFSAYLVIRNSLITQLKDVPARILWRSLPQSVAYQAHQFHAARIGGWKAAFWRSLAAFLREVPRTLAKRRRLRRDSTSTARLESLLLTEYPVRTRFPRLLGANGSQLEDQPPGLSYTGPPDEDAAGAR